MGREACACVMAVAGPIPARSLPRLEYFLVTIPVRACLLQLLIKLCDAFGELFALFTRECLHTARGSILLGTFCIKRPALSEHRFFDLIGDDGSNAAQIFADALNFIDGLPEKFQVGIQFALWPDLAQWLYG